MENSLENLNIRAWDKNSKSWKIFHENIKKGIYLIHFKPDWNIYEVRNLKKDPQERHYIIKDEEVLKPGKFIDTFKARIFSSTGYAKYWKYEHEPQRNKRTYSECFRESTTIYLIKDLSDFDEKTFVELVESFTKCYLKTNFNVISQEKRQSEYYKVISSNEDIEEKVKIMIQQVEKFIDSSISLL